MTTGPRFKSEASSAIHSAARGLDSVGAVDKATMREFDLLPSSRTNLK